MYTHAATCMRKTRLQEVNKRKRYHWTNLRLIFKHLGVGFCSKIAKIIKTAEKIVNVLAN